MVAYEARRRGYDVQAAAQDDKGKMLELSYNPFAAWVDKDEKPCEGETINAKSAEECFEWLDNKIKIGERYAFVMYAQYKFESESLDKGHMIVLDRNKKNKIRLYDPQSNTVYDEDIVEGKLDALADFSGKMPSKILRIDDKDFNSYFIDEVVHGIK